MFLHAMRRRHDHAPDLAAHPWTVPLVRDLDELHFTAPVTFLVGENGCGKSTLLEGIAAGMDALAVGRHDVERDPSLAAARALSRGFRFARKPDARKKPFMRAEDVRGFTDRIAIEMASMRAEAEDMDRAGRRGTGAGFLWGAADALANTYGEDTDARSHGETFLFLVRQKLLPGSLYLLDEPETPLSPAPMLALMALIAGAVASGCQFVIATHSPVLMAQPGAQILLAEGGRLRPVEWDDVEHVRVTRAFLRDPQGVLARVLADNS